MTRDLQQVWGQRSCKGHLGSFILVCLCFIERATVSINNAFTLINGWIRTCDPNTYGLKLFFRSLEKIVNVLLNSLIIASI